MLGESSNKAVSRYSTVELDCTLLIYRVQANTHIHAHTIQNSLLWVNESQLSQSGDRCFGNKQHDRQTQTDTHAHIPDQGCQTHSTEGLVAAGFSYLMSMKT
jgi:hypothetical protein